MLPCEQRGRHELKMLRVGDLVLRANYAKTCLPVSRIYLPGSFAACLFIKKNKGTYPPTFPRAQAPKRQRYTCYHTADRTDNKPNQPTSVAST